MDHQIRPLIRKRANVPGVRNLLHRKKEILAVKCASIASCC